MSTNRVVITGLGFITPIGNDREQVVASLREQRTGISKVDWFPDCPVRVAGTIKGFSMDSTNRLNWHWPESYVLEREVVRSMPPHGIYALCAMQQALASAGLKSSDITDGQTGLFCASAGSPRFLRHYVNEMADSNGQRAHPWSVVSSIAGTLNFNLAAHYGIKGAVTGFSSACASSAHALGYAFDEIALGRHKRMIVVGAEDDTWESLFPFSGMRALSRQADPAIASRPFDTDRDGFVGAGGAVVVVLEAAEFATQRGASISEELGGWGQSSDGHKIAQSDPDGQSLLAALRQALASARLEVADINYVNAHATSTLIGDRAEARALQLLLGDQPTPVSSTKALTGHPLSMSGAMEAAFCVLAIEEGFIPGNAHTNSIDPTCAVIQLPRQNIERAPGHVISNSCGFGGSNVCLVISAWEG